MSPPIQAKLNYKVVKKNCKKIDFLYNKKRIEEKEIYPNGSLLAGFEFEWPI